MDLMLLRMFQSQVEDQCKFVLMAAADLDRDLAQDRIAMAAADRQSAAEATDRLWFDVQSFVVSAGNLTVLLWGPAGTKAAERAELRASLGIDDSSPLAEPPDLRNHFAHADERLDRWWATSKAHNHVDRFLGPRTSLVGPDDGDVFRHLDPSTGELTFWGDRYSLIAIAREVQRIYPLARAEASKPHWIR